MFRKTWCRHSRHCIANGSFHSLAWRFLLSRLWCWWWGRISQLQYWVFRTRMMLWWIRWPTMWGIKTHKKFYGHNFYNSWPILIETDMQKIWSHFVANLSKTLHINFYQNQSGIVEVMTKKSGVTFYAPQFRILPHCKNLLTNGTAATAAKGSEGGQLGPENNRLSLTLDTVLSAKHTNCDYNEYA